MRWMKDSAGQRKCKSRYRPSVPFSARFHRWINYCSIMATVKHRASSERLNLLHHIKKGPRKKYLVGLVELMS